MSNTRDNANPQPKQELSRSLKGRHLTMISIGGIIGAGLFVGSSTTIIAGGPASFISYAICGLLLLLVMRMLGEMTTAMPQVRSFTEFARAGLGEGAGFVVGWMYWYFWVLVVPVEAIAGAKILQSWPLFSSFSSLQIGIALMTIMTGVNLMSAKSYAEFEFWFASIKVAAIVVFLVVGGVYVLGLWPGVPQHIANLTAQGGFAPNGILPVLTGAVAATGFYFGAEIVTIAAAEAAEPAKAVARATNSTISRVLVFYVGSIFLVVCLVPWNSSGIATPYVSALRAMGTPAAAQIMNAVVLTAVLSALNSGLFASSRMLFALTRRGDAPRAFATLSRRGVPVRAILLGTVFGYGAIVMSYVSPDTVFPFIVNSYGTVAIFVYVFIAVSELRLRARLEREDPSRLRLRMWAYPYLTYVAIAGMLGIVLAMGFIPDQRTPLIFGLISLALLVMAFYVRLRFGAKPDIAALAMEPHQYDQL